MLALYLVCIGLVCFWWADAGTTRVFISCALIFNYATPVSFTIAMAVYLFLGLVVPRLHPDARKPWLRLNDPATDPTAPPLPNPFVTDSPLVTADMRASVLYSIGWMRSTRRQRLCTRRWLPADAKPKALLFFCHGHGDHSGFEFAQVAYQYAAAGYGVFGVDHAGFGLSDGLHGFVPSFERMVDDVVDFTEQIKREFDPDRALPWLLMGQSMGGAIAIKMALRSPDAWDGAIFVAPMCAVQKSIQPPAVIVKLLMLIVPLIPTLAVTPTKLRPGISYSDAVKTQWVISDPLHYFGKARLGTAAELLQAMSDIDAQSAKLRVPFVVLHGLADQVTDPACSRLLYERAATPAHLKTLALYDGAPHSLMTGQPDADCKRVMRDVMAWTDKRVAQRLKDGPPNANANANANATR